ncbi:MAG: hypothetical protein WEF50_06270 [Myxococcota bacterium]
MRSHVRARERLASLVARWLLYGLACGCGGDSPLPHDTSWIASAPDEQRAQLERQLRGFDVAMLETGHRYIDLYWAGRDGNWEAAAYHVDKIRVAIENGLERRPKRAASAEPFLAGPLAATRDAVAARDAQLFAERFTALTAGCNGCHAKEKVSFFEVRPPKTRISPIRRESPAAGED